MERQNELKLLVQENEQLKKENEILLNIVIQMKKTINHLLEHYIKEQVAG